MSGCTVLASVYNNLCCALTIQVRVAIAAICIWPDLVCDWLRSFVITDLLYQDFSGVHWSARLGGISPNADGTFFARLSPGYCTPYQYQRITQVSVHVSPSTPRPLLHYMYNISPNAESAPSKWRTALITLITPAVCCRLFSYHCALAYCPAYLPHRAPSAYLPISCFVSSRIITYTIARLITTVNSTRLATTTYLHPQGQRYLPT